MIPVLKVLFDAVPGSSDVRHSCGARRRRSSLAELPTRVQFGEELAVSAPSGRELVGPLGELDPDVRQLCCKSGDAAMELFDVVGGTEAGLAPGLFADQLGETTFEALNLGGVAGASLLGGVQVGLERGPADRSRAGGRRLPGERPELFEELAMAVEEAAVDPGAASAPRTRSRRRSLSDRRPSAMAAARSAVPALMVGVPVADPPGLGAPRGF